MSPQNGPQSTGVSSYGLVISEPSLQAVAMHHFKESTCIFAKNTGLGRCMRDLFPLLALKSVLFIHDAQGDSVREKLPSYLPPPLF